MFSAVKLSVAIMFHMDAVTTCYVCVLFDCSGTLGGNWCTRSGQSLRCSEVL